MCETYEGEDDESDFSESDEEDDDDVEEEEDDVEDDDLEEEEEDEVDEVPVQKQVSTNKGKSYNEWHKEAIKKRVWMRKSS